MSPSQQTIALALTKTLTLLQTELNTPIIHKFVSDYTRDTAFCTLQSLIWEKNTDPSSNDDKILNKRVFLLAERLALSSPGIEVQTLLDLTIIYGPTYISRMRAILQSAVKTTPSLLNDVESEVAPAFTKLLSPSHSSGLYGLRKTAQCISCFLHSAPPEILRLFLRHKDFVTSLARAYDEILAAVARSYGGIHIFREQGPALLDEWEPIWVETKVALMDTFHVLVEHMLKDLSTASETAFLAESERCFDILFGLLDLSSPSANSHSKPSNHPPTPFLDRPLLADYQYAYSLAQDLASTLSRSTENDARLDVLEATFRSFDLEINEGVNKKDSGALKLLLGPQNVPYSSNKGKGKETFNDRSLPLDSGPSHHESDTPDLDLQVTQVLDILPDHSPKYIRALLAHPSYPFRGNAEKVVEALLEGTAPAAHEVEESNTIERGSVDYTEEFVYTKDRKNVFDDVTMDMSRVRLGKKRYVASLHCFFSVLDLILLFLDRQDEETVLRDRSFIEAMKSDILRRAEAMSNDEDEQDIGTSAAKVYIDVAYDDELELDGLSGVIVGGEGDESGQEDDEEEGGGPMPEMVLELAYIRDPKLFDRDAQTRRGQSRMDLKTQTGESNDCWLFIGLLWEFFHHTGWSDEQIEGWKIMLERNVSLYTLDF